MSEEKIKMSTGKSKTGKKQKNLYLSDLARQLLSALSLQMGISETAVIELLIREKAQAAKVTPVYQA